MNSDINFFAETTYRNAKRKFGIKVDDRRRHVYIIGKTGMGKTNLLKNMAIQDIMNGKGIGFVDPHGETAEELLDFVPANRINDVIYVNPSDINYPIAFNIMEKVAPEYRHLVAGGLMGVFKKIWPDVWSARMEYILNNTILALLEYPGSTLLGINRMLSDAEFRKKVVDMVTDPMIKAFWVNEFAKYAQKYETEATAAIQNKVGQFISAPLIRNIIGQVQSNIDMRKIMDEKKILILNLSKGRVGEDNSKLLGALMITKLQLAAMTRVDIPEEKRNDFFLYIDEFQNFSTESFVTILSEARKYRLDLILANQYITQMEEEVRDAVFGNVGTLISFRIGAEDADYFEKEFTPEFLATDFVNLAKYDIYLKLMIDGLAGRPFSARTLPPFQMGKTTNKEKIINVSREKCATPRLKVEEKIAKWAGFEEMSEAYAKSIPAPIDLKSGILYDAVCSVCKKSTKVVFPPDGKRPIYCKSCLKKKKNNNSGKVQQNTSITNSGSQRSPGVVAEKKSTASVSLDQAINGSTVYFGRQKEKNEPPKKRKEVDLDGLKNLLDESIEEEKTQKYENR